MNDIINNAVEDLIKDIMFVFPEVSLQTAERTAATFIRNPNMLVELDEMVKDKRHLSSENNQS